MSQILREWDRVEKELQIDLKSEYEQLYGRFFSNGINIGREVGHKLSNFEQPWPTITVRRTG